MDVLMRRICSRRRCPETRTYDAQGNQLTKTSADGVETRTYNGFGQTMSATVKGVQTIYAYRPDGLRCKKTVGTATTIHIWNGASVIADITNGAISTKYLRGAGLATREAGGKREYYMFNAHGDVVRRMDTAGNAVKEYDYDAFGNENEPDAGDANVFRYCGEYFDKETGNVYLRARYYNPGIGRFGTQDPAQIGLNWYIYAMNNPVRMADPSGMDAIVITSPGAAGGFGHTSSIVENSKTGEWKYFYWGNKAVYFVTVPKEALTSLDAFNSWNIGKDLRGNVDDKQYESATYIKGDFNASWDYYEDLSKKTVIRFETQKGDPGKYTNLSYNFFSANCLQMTSIGLNKGVLPDGTTVGARVQNNFGIPVKIVMSRLIPNAGDNTYEAVFNNSSFTKPDDEKTQFVYSPTSSRKLNPSYGKMHESIFNIASAIGGVR